MPAQTISTRVCYGYPNPFLLLYRQAAPSLLNELAGGHSHAASLDVATRGSIKVFLWSCLTCFGGKGRKLNLLLGGWGHEVVARSKNQHMQQVRGDNKGQQQQQRLDLVIGSWSVGRP